MNEPMIIAKSFKCSRKLGNCASIKFRFETNGAPKGLGTRLLSVQLNVAMSVS